MSLEDALDKAFTEETSSRIPGEMLEHSNDGVIKADNLAGIRTRVITLADAEEYVRLSGKDPDDYILTVRSKAYGHDMFSNGYTARPKSQTVSETFTLDFDAIIADQLKGWKSPKRATGAGEFSSVISISDLQLGKRLATGEGTESVLEIVRNSVQQFAKNCEDRNPAEIVMVDGGDLIENLFNYANQGAQIDLTLTQQVETAIRLWVEIIKTLAPLSPKLIVAAVPSNHGQVRTGRGEAASYVDDDWGLFINKQLEERFKDDERFTNVVFIRPDVGEETLAFDTSGTKIAVNHGHRTNGGQPGVLKWIQGQENGRQPGWDCDIWLLHHYHHLNLFTHGNGRWAFMCSAPEVGSAWFRYARGQQSGRGLTVFDTQGGKWWNLEMV